MKRTVYLNLLLFLLPFMAMAQIYPQGWLPVGPDDWGMLDPYKRGGLTVMAFDGNNRPYVAFRDEERSKKITVKRFNGTGWDVIVAPAFSTGEVAAIAIAIDQNNVPYVMYKDMGISKKAIVKRLNGTVWETVGEEGISRGEAFFNDIAIAPDNTPYIVYSDGFGSYGNRAIVKKYDSTTNTWINLGFTSGITDRKSEYNSLAFDADGTPWLTYKCYYYNIEPIRVIKYDSNNNIWAQVGATPGFYAGQVSENKATYSTLRFDGNNIPYVAYRENNISGKVAVRKYNIDNNTWDVVGTNGFSDGAASHITLAIAPDNTLYAGYSDASVSGKTTVRKYDTVTADWVDVGSKGFSVQGIDSYLVTDNNGIPYMVHSGTNNVTPINSNVMKFDEATSTWQIVGPTTNGGLSDRGANFTKLAFDHNNTPYVSYLDYSANTRPTVKKFNGTAWELVGAKGLGLTANSTVDLDFAIHSSGTPYVVYKEGNPIYVKKFDGANWVNVGPTGFSTNTPYLVKIAFDSNGIPYVAYKEGLTNSSKVTVKKYNSATNKWDNVGVQQFTAGGAQSIAIAFDKNNILYVATIDGNKTNVYKFVGTTWALVGAEGFSTGQASNISIAIDPNTNIPHVAYVDNSGNPGKATVKKYSSTDNIWETVGTERFSTEEARNTSIAIDNEGVIYVAYGERPTSQQTKATVKKFNATTNSWVGAGPETFSAKQVQYVSLAIDNNGLPYLAYNGDYSNNAATTDYAFVKRMDIDNNPLPVKLTSFTAKVRGKSINVQWATATEQNTSHFVVERSQNGNNFYPLVRVMAKGNANQIQNYQFTDHTPLSGTAYYRLKTYDLDGTFEIHRPVAVGMAIETKSTVSIFPNPTGQTLWLATPTGITPNTAYQIIDTKGAIVQKGILQQQYTNQINIGQLPRGIYWLWAANETQKFIKQ